MKKNQNDGIALAKDSQGGFVQAKETSTIFASTIACKMSASEYREYKRFDSLKGRTIKLDLCKQD